jgi:trigger factor
VEQQNVQTFENADYSVEAMEGAGCLLMLTLFVKPKQSQKTYQKAVKIVNKQISIPGFRKGHAPDHTVIGRYGSYVEQEWKEIIVNEAYRAALELTNIYPMNKESIQKPKIEKCSQEEGAIIHLSYEHYPNIPVVDFSQIKILAVEKRAVSEEKVEAILEEARRSHADWENVEGRGVEVGDFVDLSIDSLREDPPKPIVKEARFEVDDERFPSWLKKLLIGLNIGESVEGESEVEAEADDALKQSFQATKVRVTLHAIKKILLPEVNDELAQKVGAESVEDLKNKIRQNLEKEGEEEYKQRRIEALEEALLERYHFDLPASIVASERKERLSKRLHALKKENLAKEEMKVREEELGEEVDKEIDRSLRLYFLKKQIAKQGKISLTNQELNDELARYLGQRPYLYGKESDEAATRELVSRMATLLMQRKTNEYALSQVEAA